MKVGVYVMFDIAAEESSGVQLFKNDRTAARWYVARMQKADIVAPGEEMELRFVGRFDTESCQLWPCKDAKGYTKVNVPLVENLEVKQE